MNPIETDRPCDEGGEEGSGGREGVRREDIMCEDDKKQLA